MTAAGRLGILPSGIKSEPFMRHTRRTLLCGLGGVGLMLAAAPALAAEDTATSMRGWSGVDLQVGDGVASIRDLEPLGPAARAGLRPGDLIVGCNGGGVSLLPAALSGQPGELVELMVRRGTGRRIVRLVLEEPESARP